MKLGFDYHVFVCENQRPAGHPRGCCINRGGHAVRGWFREILEERGLLEGKNVNGASCLGYCDAGPLVVFYPEGIWYRAETREDVAEIVDSHLAGGKPVDRLLAEKAF